MPVTTRRLQDLTIEDHTITVPLVWGDPDDGRTIDVHAAVVARDGGESLPYLVFLQGGPGHESPRAFHSPSAPNWLDAALEQYRVVLLDQRGTGRSTPVGDADLERGTDELVERITHLRADAIVRDCEAMREHLAATTWSVLGQSLGGFTTLAYLSTDASSLQDVYITGGLSALGRHPDEIYSATYDKMRTESERYYRRFPEHRDAMRRLADLADAGGIRLPSGEVLSVSRLRSVGMLLGTNDGWQSLWTLLEHDPGTNAFRYDLAAALPFSARNPLYYVFHESSYADGFATQWSAERTEPDDFRDDPTLLTGEHVRREWLDTVPGLQPWRDVTLALAEVEWPRLYDAGAIAASGARGATSIYVNDAFVPFEFAIETSGLIPGVLPWITSEHEHNGLRAGDVLERLIELAHGRRVR
ncbi:alpha/beta hydrolase [Microbacterium immunditiarum]|uniref:Pimeloyl-ACP methyl ester carboxylesterase n=1 Tax=Microbacterium immunditiarum TaxID=337480 RepID=A0A7Y9GL51_9MICO|nr:alpha/beta fold hydrolase [Microbacterium immunditiarum]NYE18481.1 pimeloyl-ACP methyl ester carboxylesterase [Microbacterium immunditiarum]